MPIRPEMKERYPKGGQMPGKHPRSCAVPICPNLVYLGSYCDEHRKQYRKQTDHRPSSSKRGYGANWRKKRDAYLRSHRICEEPGCEDPACVVDHIKPMAEGGIDHESNYQAFCRRHHSRKTAKHDGGFGNRRRKHHVE